jgi:hypothetical protein
MKFGLVNAVRRQFLVAVCDDLNAAKKLVGLDPLGVDHGVVMRNEDGGIALVVAEFGLFEPVDKQHFFSIGTHLYAGSAVLYAFDASGETIDFPSIRLPIRFFLNHREVDAAIADGEIVRPQMAMNDVVFWRWPEPQPK